MEFNEDELCMIEQLCYLDSDVATMAGIGDKFNGIKIKNQGKSIENILKCFNDTALAKLEALGDKEVGGSCISGKEWADIIRYIKADENCGIQK